MLNPAYISAHLYLFDTEFIPYPAVAEATASTYSPTIISLVSSEIIASVAGATAELNIPLTVIDVNAACCGAHAGCGNNLMITEDSNLIIRRMSGLKNFFH